MSESQDRDQDTGDHNMVIDESADTSQDVLSDQDAAAAAAIAKSVVMKQKRKRKNSDGDSILKGGASPVKNKKKKKKDKNAPHKPLNGYVLFLNQNRSRIIQEHPGLEFAEVTKKLAKEWTVLPEEQRQPFMQRAEQDRQRYKQELQQYKNSADFRTFQQSLLTANQKESEKTSRKSAAGGVQKKKPGPKPKQKTSTVTHMPAAVRAPSGTTIRSENSPSVTPDLWSAKSEIPIFTEDFLEHNKVRETELRLLRKSTTEHEEQNAILSKHIDKMRGAVVRMEAEMNQMREKNAAVEQTLNQLKADFVSEFATRPVPGTSMYPTAANVEEYMESLLISIERSGENKENKVTQEKVRKVMSKVLAADDLQTDQKPVVTMSSVNSSSH